MKKIGISIILLISVFLGLCPKFIVNATEVSYKEGTYEVSNKVLKIDSDEESLARKNVNETSIVEIAKDSKYITVGFTGTSLMESIKIFVSNEEVKYDEIEKENDSLKAKFKVNSLKDTIVVDSIVNAGFFKKSVSYRIILDTSFIVEDDNNSGSDDSNGSNNNGNIGNSGNTSNGDTGNSGSVGGTTNNVPGNTTSTIVKPDTTVNNGNYSIYKIRNEILTSSSIGYSAARAAVNEYCYYEEINNEKYITVGFSSLDIMNNIRISVDGNNVSYETIREDSGSHTKDIRFKVSSLNSNIKVTAHITAIGTDISFGLDLLENTLELISKSEAQVSLSSNMGSSPVFNNLLSTVDNVEGDTSELEDEQIDDSEIEVKGYFKKYTINNEIVSDSVIGKTMTRKYVDETSILEEIDGVYYLTVKFLNKSSMDNIRVNVNGKEVKYSVIAKDKNNDSLAIRFKIGNINDDITIYLLVKAMNRDVDFGLKLLEDTMVLIDEGEVYSSKARSNDTALATLMNSKEGDSTNTIKVVGISVICTAATILLIQGIAFYIIKRRKVIE